MSIKKNESSEEVSNKILIVEDEDALASVLSSKFQLAGFSVLVAVDGEDGLNKIGTFQPDLILLDIILPKMDGFEILKTIKADKNLKNIPVILLTNLSQKDEVKKGLDLGANDYLIKAHYMPSEVINKVKKILAEASQKEKK